MGDSEPLVCYTVGFNFVTSSNQYFPCGGNGTSSGGAQACCYAGDYCMEDSICHYTHEVTNGTGYYMAGCTDSSWQDPACPKQCTSEYGADIIYDSTNDHWNCCFSRDGFLNCQQPSDFVVQAPSPGKLQTLSELNTPAPSASLTQIRSISSYLGAISTISGAPESSSSLASTTAEPSLSPLPSQNTAASATATSSTSPTATPSSSSSSLSGGVIAGIVVGCIAGLTILAIAALILYRWNQTNNAAIRKHKWGGNNPNAAELGGSDASGKREAYAHLSDKPLQPPHHGSSQNPGGWGLSSTGAAGYSSGAGVGQYHELSSPEKDMPQPQELMGSTEREPAELGDGRKSMFGG